MHECESDPHVRKRTPSFIRTYSAERAFVRPGSSAMAAGFGRTQSVHASFNYFSAVARTPSSDSFSLKRTESLLKTGEQDLSNPLGQTTPETSDASKIRRSSAALKEELQSQCARFILSDVRTELYRAPIGRLRGPRRGADADVIHTFTIKYKVLTFAPHRLSPTHP